VLGWSAGPSLAFMRMRANLLNTDRHEETARELLSKCHCQSRLIGGNFVRFHGNTKTMTGENRIKTALGSDACAGQCG